MSDAAATVTVQASTPVQSGDKGGQAIAALVLGIVSVVMIWIPFSGLFIGGITGILGIIFGAISRKSVRRNMALWGMWLGIVGLVIGFIEIICGIIFVASLFSQPQPPQYYGGGM